FASLRPMWSYCRSMATPQAVTFAGSVTSFQLVSGLPQWGPASQARLGRTVFQIRADGTFLMVQPDGYPALVGRMDGNGTFRAQASSSVGSTASTQVEVIGRLDARRATMSLTYASGGAMAAVVNGTHFGSNSTKVFRATLALRTA
ncbi:hypothetical protein, partial [Pseudonocardia pini]|uniref:hypothetical protein n=1 Tax=Pseudonocardia pini TaxID=2758030 RepID=UPI001C68B973